MFLLRAGFKSRINNVSLILHFHHIYHIDVVTGRYVMIGNRGGVTNLSESFEVLSLFVM